MKTQCQAEKYDPRATDYERCDSEGKPFHMSGLLLTVLVDLCQKHVDYFDKAGYDLKGAQ